MRNLFLILAALRLRLDTAAKVSSHAKFYSLNAGEEQRLFLERGYEKSIVQVQETGTTAESAVSHFVTE